MPAAFLTFDTQARRFEGGHHLILCLLSVVPGSEFQSALDNAETEVEPEHSFRERSNQWASPQLNEFFRFVCRSRESGLRLFAQILSVLIDAIDIVDGVDAALRAPALLVRLFAHNPIFSSEHVVLQIRSLQNDLVLVFVIALRKERHRDDNILVFCSRQGAFPIDAPDALLKLGRIPVEVMENDRSAVAVHVDALLADRSTYEHRRESRRRKALENGSSIGFRSPRNFWLFGNYRASDASREVGPPHN